MPAFSRPARGVLAILASSILVPSPASAQTGARPDDRDAVLATIASFFRTMTEKDVEGARDVLDPRGRFFSVRPDPDGGRSVRTFTNQEYLDGLAAGRTRQAERIWNAQVRIHGDVANVWAPYDFHLDGAFSHCGVDSFDLVRTPVGWRITGGVYTVQTEGCPPSPLGPAGRERPLP